MTENNNFVSLNEMSLLQSTRDHLIRLQFSKDIGFESLSLYQTIRLPAAVPTKHAAAAASILFSNGATIAFTGLAIFDTKLKSPANESIGNSSTRIKPVEMPCYAVFWESMEPTMSISCDWLDGKLCTM